MTCRSRIILLFLLTVGASGIAATQNLRESAREQALRDPTVPVMHVGPPHEYQPKPIEDVARESEVIVLARLSRIRSYLTPNADRVLTDYAIVGANVLVGRFTAERQQMPGPGVPQVLTVYGGEVVIDGVTVRSGDPNLGAITEGALISAKISVDVI